MKNDFFDRPAAYLQNDSKKHSDSMKYKLAQAMKICMQKTSLEKITVSQVVQQCGTTRQTFYRNFKDKYDLVNWYFDRILLESFEHMGEGILFPKD